MSISLAVIRIAAEPLQDNFYNYCLSESSRRDQDMDADRVSFHPFSSGYRLQLATRVCTQETRKSEPNRKMPYLDCSVG